MGLRERNNLKIAIHGLGRMGAQISKKLSEAGHEVVAHNRSQGPTDEAVSSGAKAAKTKTDVLNAFKTQQLILWIMLPADVIEEELKAWLEVSPRGSIIIDGGNSDYRLTKKRALNVEKAGSILLDVGTSGGVWGYKNGFSMMAGGNEDGFKTIKPILKTLSQPHGGYQYFGPSGSGHFVKMVHNAIEYGMMQSLAEGYRLLNEGPYSNLDLAAAGDVWQSSSVVASWLNDLTRQALHEDPTLKQVEGKVAESGEARWALETARELGIPMPAIQSAFDVRLKSQHGQVNFSTKLLAAMRNKFGGHNLDGS